MPSVCPVVTAIVRRRRAQITFALAVLVVGASVGCSLDSPGVTEQLIESDTAPATAANSIIVSSSADLVAALAPENAGRRIHMRAGVYGVTQPLTVPDRATLEGEGEMLLDDAGLPTGFTPATRTVISMTANTAGDVLTLGNGARIRKLAIEDLPGRVGNVVAANSRDAGDNLRATIEDVEITNPNTHAIVPAGPSGCGVTALTLNPNLGSDPPPHTNATVSVTMTRSLIHSPATGTGCGVFAFNFASSSSISVTLTHNVVGGGIIANGGVSRPDEVHDSKTDITSQRNVYHDDSPNPCTSKHVGWNLTGGSGTPVNFVIGETARNTLSIHSLDDRIEGFTTGVFATATRRFFALPTAGPSTDNRLDIELIGATVSTPSCGGASFVIDFRMAGALVSNASLVPGDGNILRAVFRNVTGSGTRANVYADVVGPAGPVSPEFRGTGNRLEFDGSVEAFGLTNTAIDPAPGEQFFTGSK